MRFLKLRWISFIVGILLSMCTTAGLIYSQKAALFANLPQVNIETPPLLWSFRNEEVEKLISELRAERKNVEKREIELESMSAQIASERAELEKVRNDIQVSRNQLSASIVEMQEAEAKNLKSLSATYSAIAAPAAVSVLMEMDEAMAVKILSLMKPDKVGAIFQEMARSRTGDGNLSKRAAQLSDKLRMLKAKKDVPKP